jgi:hypothetical protein
MNIGLPKTGNQNAMKKIFIYTFWLLSFASPSLKAQVDSAWLRTWGNEYWNENHIVSTDNSGNIFSLGWSYYSGSNYDYATSKFDEEGNVIWSRDFSYGPGDFIDVPAFARCDASGILVTVGQVACSGYGCPVQFIKYGAGGDTLLMTTDFYYSDLLIYSVTMDDDGNFIIAGRRGSPSSGVVAKFSSDGMLLWGRETYSPTGGYCRFNDVTTDGDGNIYAAGAVDTLSHNFDVCMVKYNPDGELLWKKTWNGSNSYNDEASDIALDHYGNIYAAGTTCISSEYVSDILIMKYDNAGNLLWLHSYDGPGATTDYTVELVTDGDDAVYLTGATGLGGFNNYDYITMKHSRYGTLLWTESFGYSGLDEPQKMIIDDKANLFITGYTAMPTGGFNGVTLKYDSSGTENWVAYYDGGASSEDELYDITIDLNKDIIVAGRTYDNTASFNFLLIKYNNSISGIPVVPSGDHNLHLSATPNPFHHETMISFYLPQSSQATLTIIDINGVQVLKLLDGMQTSGNHTQAFNPVTLPAGVYFCKLATAYGFASTKLIITEKK